MFCGCFVSSYSLRCFFFLFLSFRLQEKFQEPSGLLLALPFAAFTGA